MLWILEHGRCVRRAGEIEVREARQHLNVRAVLHDDFEFEGVVFPGADDSVDGRPGMAQPGTERKTANDCDT
jgi:hypothetical protein